MSEQKQMTGQLVVTAPPFWHCGRTIRGINTALLLGLAPAALMAIASWGMPAARVMALAMLTGVVVEALCQKAMQRDLCVNDLSTVVSSLLLAFLLPANAPWWLVIVGVTVAITLGKMAFGGLGTNPVNTALVGWAMLSLSWPVLIDPNAMQLDTLWSDPLTRFHYFGAESASEIGLWNLIIGHQIGGLGASQTGLLLLGGLCLTLRGYLRWEIVASFLGSVFVVASLFWLADPSSYASPMFHLFAGSTMLGGFFLATEGASSPSRRLPMILYGCLGGTMVMLIRTYGVYSDGVPFAILLINLLAPLLNSLGSKPFGTR